MTETAPAQSVNILEALSRQVERVATLRERYSCLGGMPSVNIQPLCFMIDAALETAHRAAGSGDIPSIACSLQDLAGFDDWPAPRRGGHAY